LIAAFLVMISTLNLSRPCSARAFEAQVDLIFDRFFIKRIGLRFLIQHHIEAAEAAESALLPGSPENGCHRFTRISWLSIIYILKYLHSFIMFISAHQSSPIGMFSTM